MVVITFSLSVPRVPLKHCLNRDVKTRIRIQCRQQICRSCLDTAEAKTPSMSTTSQQGRRNYSDHIRRLLKI